MNLSNVQECENNECAGCAWCDAVAEDLARFQLTGELPAAWTPDEAPAIDDAQLDEAMREREAIESGCVEAPRFGWLNMIGRGAL